MGEKEIDYKRTKPTGNDLNFLLKLFNEQINFEYDASDNLQKITIYTKDSQGNDKTIIYNLSYDASGNLININKEVV